MTAGVLTLALVLAAQTTELPTLIMPAGADAWVIRVVTTGGFTGRGSGSVTASSAGDVFCVQLATCPDRLVPDTTRVLSQLVSALPVEDRRSDAPPVGTSVCNDCVTTTMTVRVRSGAGERVQRYVWDSSTAAAIPDGVRRLHAAVVALSPSRAR